MPRSAALLSLSREHHASLVMARAARKAAESGDKALYKTTMARIQAHWQTVLAAHFAQEEELLRRMGDALDPEWVARVFAEHRELRTLACESNAPDPAARLSRFGDLLAAHVRFEERVLFPQLESRLGARSASDE